MSVSIQVHDLQSTQKEIEGVLVAPPEQIQIFLDDAIASETLKPGFKSIDSHRQRWSCSFDSLELQLSDKIDHDVMIKIDVVHGDEDKRNLNQNNNLNSTTKTTTSLIGRISQKDLLTGFQNFIIPLYVVNNQPQQPQKS